MLLFTPPNAPFMPMHTSALTQEHAATDIPTYGVCAFATSPFIGGNDLDPSRYLLNLLPADFRNRVRNNSLSPKDWEVFAAWEKRISVKITHQPKHGQASLPGLLYFSNKGYTGKDRIEAIVSGPDLSGGEISMRLIYFINVVSTKDFNFVAESYYRSLWKYCHSKSESWRISQASKGVTKEKG